MIDGLYAPSAAGCGSIVEVICLLWVDGRPAAYQKICRTPFYIADVLPLKRRLFTGEWTFQLHENKPSKSRDFRWLSALANAGTVTDRCKFVPS